MSSVFVDILSTIWISSTSLCHTPNGTSRDKNKSMMDRHSKLAFPFLPQENIHLMDRKGEAKPILIAMKGHPGTGKSTLANAISKALKYPLIDKDHFRDCTYTIEQALRKACPSTATKLLNDLSYEAMWRVILTQLDLGLSVVVDSPLSRRAHLDQLLEMASRSGARVVIIECRPADEPEWRRRLEERGADGGSGWHRPSSWEEMERLLEGYGGCWDYDVGEVAKLVVDTTAPVEVGDMVSKVIEFVNS